MYSRLVSAQIHSLWGFNCSMFSSTCLCFSLSTAAPPLFLMVCCIRDASVNIQGTDSNRQSKELRLPWRCQTYPRVLKELDLYSYNTNSSIPVTQQPRKEIDSYCSTKWKCCRLLSSPFLCQTVLHVGVQTREVVVPSRGWKWTNKSIAYLRQSNGRKGN